MRFLLIIPLLFFLTKAQGQDSTIVVRVEFYGGGGSSTFVFTEAGNLQQALLTGGPVWRKDTVIRRIQRPNPGVKQQVVRYHQRNGEQALLLERIRSRKGHLLAVKIDSYDPVLEVTSSEIVYQIDEQERITEARITKGLPNQKVYPEETAVFTYQYGEERQCTIIDTFTKQVVLEIVARKKRTVVRLMEKRNVGYEYTFDLDGVLKSKTYRSEGLGKQTEFHIGKNGLKVSGMSFSLSVSSGPSPRALWRSVPIKEKELKGAVSAKIIEELFESLAFQNSSYRRFFPRGFSPAEMGRD